MLVAATRYAFRNERGWVIPNLIGLLIGLLFDVQQAITPSSETLSPLGVLVVVTSVERIEEFLRCCGVTAYRVGSTGRDFVTP